MRILQVALVFATVIFLTSCGSDGQVDPITIPGDAENMVRDSLVGNDLQSVDKLLSEGLRLEAPFVLGPGSPTVAVMYLESVGALEASVRADGFDGPLESLIVVENANGTLGNVLLHIRKDGVFDASGTRLVDQIQADNGYAWRVGTSSNEALLGRRSFISVILLDVDGAGISDELYIYWNPESGSDRGFVVTNIPNEIL